MLSLSSFVDKTDPRNTSKELSLQTKVRYVSTWAEQFYDQESSVPPFEKDERTINLLFQLAITNNNRDQKALDLIEIYQGLILGYKTKECTTMETLSKLGISLEKMTQAAKEVIDNMVSASIDLHLVDTNENSVLLGLSKVSEELLNSKMALHHLKAEKKRLRYDLETLEKRLQDFSRAKERLDSKKELESPILENCHINESFFDVKIQDYEDEIENLINSLTENGFYDKDLENIGQSTTTLSHSALGQLETDVADVNERIVPLEKRILHYHKLPPDVSLAHIVLKEAENLVVKLENDVKQIDFGVA